MLRHDGADTSQFAWLLGTGSAPPRRQLDNSSIDAAWVFALASWQVLPVVEPRLLDWLGSRNFKDRAEELRTLRESVSALARIQMALCFRFTGELERQQVPYALLKGSASRLTAYSHPELRGALDVDVAVPSAHIRRAEGVARDLGFEPALLVDREGRRFQRVGPALRAAVETEHYELACLVRRQVIRGLEPDVEAAVRASLPRNRPWHLVGDELACYVTLDLHHGLSLDIPVDVVVNTAVRAGSSPDEAAFVPNFQWQVFHLIFKLYWEGVHNYRKGAYQYADLVRLIPMVTGAAAEELIELLRAYRLEVAAYYVLRRLEVEFGQEMGEELQAMITEHARSPDDMLPLEVNDLGDVWPKLWGLR